MNIYTPVDALPILTSGRNSSGADTDHPYIDILDNNMDTYFKPDSFNNSVIYIDIGANPPDVDTIVFWLHNYNQSYTKPKELHILNSDTDSSYVGTMPITIFSLITTGYSPLAIAVLNQTYNKRYWLVNLRAFNETPISFKPEISAIWFCNKKTLSHSHQRPEQDSIKYNNRKNITQSGIVLNEPAGFGSTTIRQRKFISTVDTAYWDVLKDLHAKTRARQRPFFMVPDLLSSNYHALVFHNSLSDNLESYQYHSPNISLREVGHKKIPFQNRKLYPLAETIGLWRFRDLNGTDDSGSGNNLTNIGLDSTDFLSGGVTEQGITVLEMEISDRFEIASGAPSSDFEMGMSDFTIEAWVLIKSTIAGGDRSRLRKISFGPTTGWDLTIWATGFKWAMNIGDGTNGLFIHTGVEHNDDKWHLITIVINRTSDTYSWYVDGVVANTGSIANITGNISQSSVPLRLQAQHQDDQVWWDEICVTKRKLTATEILNRYTGREDYGDWSN